VQISLDGILADDSLRVDLSSFSLAPYRTHTGGKEWREKLDKGAIVDCMDTAGNWYTSTVIDIRREIISNKNITLLKIGYRQYMSEGFKEDFEGNRYNGWSSTYDEWLNAFSIRVQRANTIAKIGRVLCNKDIDNKFLKEDMNDILINTVEGEVYGILKHNIAQSVAIVNIVNEFGKNKGFHSILERMHSKTITYRKLL